MRAFIQFQINKRIKESPAGVDYVHKAHAAHAAKGLFFLRDELERKEMMPYKTVRRCFANAVIIKEVVKCQFW